MAEDITTVFFGIYLIKYGYCHVSVTIGSCWRTDLKSVIVINCVPRKQRHFQIKVHFNGKTHITGDDDQQR